MKTLKQLLRIKYPYQTYSEACVVRIAKEWLEQPNMTIKKALEELKQ
jgi:hypothetical protein